MKYRQPNLLLVLALILCKAAYSQSTFVPQNLGEAINSPYDDILPVISRDGKTLYFTRLNHPENKFGIKNSADIWYARRQPNGGWSKAERLVALNTGRYNSLLSLSADNKEALLYGDKGLNIATASGDTWAIQPLKVRASKDATISADGKHLVYSKGGKIYLLEKMDNGAWGKPLALKALHMKKETTPFLMPDNKTLYFASDRNNKQFDIYKSVRMGSDWSTWSAPVALNDTINTPQLEGNFKTNGIGSWAFYTSTAHSLGKADIFSVKVYEDNPFVMIKGNVVNAVTKRLLKNTRVSWTANGLPVDSVAYNLDSASFRVKLPMGKDYTLTAAVDHYHPFSMPVRAADVKEFTVIHQDMEEGPLPYVLVKGKLLIKNTDQAIPAKAKPAIVVDGEAVDSARIDSEGNYELKLNHGAIYYLQVSAKRFESFPAVVELDKVDGYEEIKLDLQADAEKMAIVTGKLINKKTSHPMDSTIHTAIQVEGISAVYAIVDSLTASYEVRLPLHENYTVSAAASQFYPVYEIIDVVNENNEVKINQDLTLVPVEKGQAVPLKGIFFEPGKVKLLEESNPELDRLVAFLQEHPKIKIEIEGYTYKNIKLSTATAAKAVASYLTSKGITTTRISSRGYGSSRPILQPAPASGKQTIKIEFTFTAI